MAWIIPIVAALGAVGAQAYGASQTPKKQGPSFADVPQPDWVTALGQYMGRISAANATNQPPSFGNWLAGGGQPWKLTDPKLTPGEAIKLGFVGGENQAIPSYDPNGQTQMSPEQVAYIGANRIRGRMLGTVTGPETLLERYRRLQEETPIMRQMIESGTLTPGRELRLRRLLQARTGRLNRLTERFGFGGPNG